MRIVFNWIPTRSDLLFRILVFFCGLLIDSGFSRPVQSQELNPVADYSASLGDQRTVDVDFAVVVTAPYHTKLLKVWVPLPQSDVAQKISSRTFESFPDDVKPIVSTEKKFGNRFAYFEFRNPQGAQIIHQRFRVVVSELSWHVDPEKVQLVSKWPESFVRHFDQPEGIVLNKEFQEVISQMKASSVTTEKPEQVNIFNAMNWIDRNLSYDHIKASLQADPVHAMTFRRGHCSDYHGLCAAMGRSFGCPTRLTYGLQLFPKSSPSHCKLEAYLPPYGWVSFDLSETQKLVAKIKTSDHQEKGRLIDLVRNRTKQGYRENSWLLVTRGTDYELAPPASRRVKVVRTIYAEADGVRLPEPDPANEQQNKFAWMTAHKFTSDKPFEAAFKNLERLKSYSRSTEK